MSFDECALSKLANYFSELDKVVYYEYHNLLT